MPRDQVIALLVATVCTILVLHGRCSTAYRTMFSCGVIHAFMPKKHGLQLDVRSCIMPWRSTHLVQELNISIVVSSSFLFQLTYSGRHGQVGQNALQPVVLAARLERGTALKHRQHLVRVAMA